jgi:hypothetical protein
MHRRATEFQFDGNTRNNACIAIPRAFEEQQVLFESCAAAASGLAVFVLTQIELPLSANEMAYKRLRFVSTLYLAGTV